MTNELKNGAAWTEWMVCWCVLMAEVCGAMCSGSITSVSSWACRNASSRLLIETCGVREPTGRNCRSPPHYSGRSGGVRGRKSGTSDRYFLPSSTPERPPTPSDPIKTLKNLFLAGGPRRLVIGLL